MSNNAMPTLPSHHTLAVATVAMVYVMTPPDDTNPTTADLDDVLADLAIKTRASEYLTNVPMEVRVLASFIVNHMVKADPDQPAPDPAEGTTVKDYYAMFCASSLPRNMVLTFTKTNTIFLATMFGADFDQETGRLTYPPAIIDLFRATLAHLNRTDHTTPLLTEMINGHNQVPHNN